MRVPAATHLVPFIDAFRLGQFKGCDSDHPSRPLLVKLSNVWDKRLILAAKRNLKDFREVICYKLKFGK